VRLIHETKRFDRHSAKAKLKTLAPTSWKQLKQTPHLNVTRCQVFWALLESGDKENHANRQHLVVADFTQV